MESELDKARQGFYEVQERMYELEDQLHCYSDPETRARLQEEIKLYATLREAFADKFEEAQRAADIAAKILRQRNYDNPLWGSF